MTRKVPLLGASSSRGVPKNLWKAIWTMKAPPKVNHFLWRASNLALLTKMSLFKRKCARDPICLVCGVYDETIKHMLFFCERARTIWFCEPLSVRVDICGLMNAEDWFVEFF